MLLTISVFYPIAFAASWATLSLSMAIEKPNAELRDLPFFQNLEYNEATPLAIDPNPAMQENLQEQRQLQFELAVFGATEIAWFALELWPDNIVYRMFFGNANAEQ
ncbi:hypothetical protein MMC31_002314 [Peltigera leucophlebia]|nr:hypothetical protein [Peltigera leucophlebia]